MPFSKIMIVSETSLKSRFSVSYVCVCSSITWMKTSPNYFNRVFAQGWQSVRRTGLNVITMFELTYHCLLKLWGWVRSFCRNIWKEMTYPKLETKHISGGYDTEKAGKEHKKEWQQEREKPSVWEFTKVKRKLFSEEWPANGKPLPRQFILIGPEMYPLDLMTWMQFQWGDECRIYPVMGWISIESEGNKWMAYLRCFLWKGEAWDN